MRYSKGDILEHVSRITKAVYKMRVISSTAAIILDVDLSNTHLNDIKSTVGIGQEWTLFYSDTFRLLHSDLKTQDYDIF